MGLAVWVGGLACVGWVVPCGAWLGVLSGGACVALFLLAVTVNDDIILPHGFVIC